MTVKVGIHMAGKAVMGTHFSTIGVMSNMRL
jgi:hypothetical protein